MTEEVHPASPPRTADMRKAQQQWLQQEADRTLADVIEKHPQYSEVLVGTSIRISSRLTRSAGNACPESRTVGISEPIFSVEENLPQLRNTILHELAHVIAGPDAKAHGKVWRSIFIEIGGNGERCHQLRARGQHRSFQAKCERCQEDVEVGTRVWNRLKGGSRDYSHQGCGGVVSAPVESNEADRGSIRWIQKLGQKLRQALLFE
ncbi:MAG: SprT-like domain-containing protein [Planctomycetota bacterium]|nr:SprT-like domain-containing protein [Planctomycetota bacterium]